MGRYLAAKCKICRRADEKLFLKGTRCETAKCPMENDAKRKPPGNAKRRARLTEYGTHLREAQRAKRMYGIYMRQFTNTFNDALSQGGNTGNILLEDLELRLDNIVYRLHLGLSRSHARQMITHGHINVNGKRVRTPSYRVSAGDVISHRDKENTKKMITESVNTPERPDVPSWLALDEKTMQGTVVQKPSMDELQVALDPLLIVEYMSR